MRRLLEKIAAESRGTLSVEAIEANLASGKWALICPRDGTAFVIEEYTTSTGMKIAEAVGVAGDSMDGWFEAVSKIENEAKARGIQRLRGVGRVGWAKVAKKFGWKMTSVVVEKDL